MSPQLFSSTGSASERTADADNGARRFKFSALPLRRRASVLRKQFHNNCTRKAPEGAADVLLCGIVAAQWLFVKNALATPEMQG